MIQSKTDLKDVDKSGEVFRFIFTNPSYIDYHIQYNFITGHLKLILPNSDTFYTIQLKAFLQASEVTVQLKKNATIMLMIDIFLIDVNPYGREYEEYIITERKLNSKTILESKFFN
jgi:hypothetical protein